MAKHENVQIILGYSVRNWTNYTVTAALTDEEVEVLSAGGDDAVALARTLSARRVLVEQGTDEEEGVDPFDSDTDVVDVAEGGE